MIELIPFEAEHASVILSGSLNDERNRPSPAFGKFIPGLVIEDMAYTGLVDGEIIGAAGIYPLWPGVGEGWFIATSRSWQHGRSVARVVREGIAAIAYDKNLWRVQANMRSDWPHLKRWAEYLGMKHEGTMRRYGADGLDYERWAWVDGC